MARGCGTRLAGGTWKDQRGRYVCGRAAEPVTTTSKPRLRVLLVDQDHRVRAALVRLLSATNPDWLVSAVATLPTKTGGLDLPEIALVDVPSIDTADALAAIARLSGAAVPVLAISADDARRGDALEAGASGFLAKDANIELLVHEVRLTTAATSPAHPPSPTPAGAGPVPIHTHPEVPT